MQNREGVPKTEQELMRYPVKQEKVFRLHVKYGSGLSIAIHVHVCFTTDVIRQCLWYIFTVVEYIHHILFAVMPLVGIAQFNTDPLENFCLAEWWMEQQSQLQDSARGHRHHYKH